MENRRRILLQKQNDLPIGYTRLHYVYCDGTQPYITVTGISNIPAIIKLRVKQDTGYTIEEGVWGLPGRYEIYYQRNKLKVWTTGGAVANLITDIYGDVDEIIAKIINWVDENASFSLGIYRNNSYRYHGKIYSLELWNENNIKIYDFVPCVRDADGVVGFIDLVSKIFYPPQGPAVFIPGM